MSTSTALVVYDTTVAVALGAGERGELIAYDATHGRDAADPHWFQSMAHGSLEVQAALGLAELPAEQRGGHEPGGSAGPSGTGAWSTANQAKRRLTHKLHKQHQVHP